MLCCIKRPSISYHLGDLACGGGLNHVSVGREHDSNIQLDCPDIP